MVIRATLRSNRFQGKNRTFFFALFRPWVLVESPGLNPTPWARSIQPNLQPVRPGKVVHLKRWTRFFETFLVGPNRSIEFWTEVCGNFGWMDRAPYLTVLPTELVLLQCTIQALELLIICHIIIHFLSRRKMKKVMKSREMMEMTMMTTMIQRMMKWP